jgi:hypothetical protein
MIDYRNQFDAISSEMDYRRRTAWRPEDVRRDLAQPQPIESWVDYYRRMAEAEQVVPPKKPSLFQWFSAWLKAVLT